MKNIVSLFVCLGFSMAVLAQESYRIASESQLTIDGTSTVHNWTVSANKMKGSLSLQNGSPAAINFEVTVADIISERGATMDKKMHAALKKETHPKVSFVLEQTKNTAILVGVLVIAGIEKTVEIDAEIETDGSELKIKGEKKIILQDFEINPPTAMFGQIIVGDEVSIKFDLIFNRI
ncbi:MAG: YceI family protein [Maribacter sp.]|uniref:YceI family protein n=1 Tax=Maribacter sp. TaxID=1897614 RepID=UPI003298B648